MKNAKHSIIKAVSILLAVATLSSFAGCGKADNESSDVEVVYEYEYQTGSKSTGNNEGTESGSNDGTDGSKVTGTTASGTTSGSTAKPNKKPGSNTVNDGIDPEKYRGSTVVYATWKNPFQNEDGAVINAFTKKYGIKVKIDTTPQLTYVSELIGKIASGNAPDVFFETDFFPYSLAALQPIDAMKLNTKEAIWDKGALRTYTIDGKTYLVNTVGNIWSEVDCLFYNKKIFKDNNITTPEQYYAKGTWNFAAFQKCMEQLKSAGYIGAYIDVQALIASTGANVYSYSNGKFSNGMTGMTTNVLTKIAEWTENKLIKPTTDSNLINNFIIGKAGMALTNAYGLKATGYFSGMNPNDIGYTYIPSFDANNKAVPSGMSRAYGLCRGAKHPVEAGLFLRYYLDVNNYDLKSSFITEDAQKFFFKLTTLDTDKKNMYFLYGVSTMSSGPSLTDIKEITTGSSKQVVNGVSSIKNKIDASVKNTNAEIAKQLKDFK